MGDIGSSGKVFEGHAVLFAASSDFGSQGCLIRVGLVERHSGATSSLIQRPLGAMVTYRQPDLTAPQHSAVTLGDVDVVNTDQYTTLRRLQPRPNH
ncbi:hypothetical protein MTOK_51460 [Mycolicibacterium tokaiense]|nr:hypothetical protein MTOK_51460 [Mycolicibacterium tokaiense]